MIAAIDNLYYFGYSFKEYVEPQNYISSAIFAWIIKYRLSYRVQIKILNARSRYLCWFSGIFYRLSTLEANWGLLSTTPEECQKEIQRYLLINFCGSSAYKLLSENEILWNPAELRRCYENGEGEEFDLAIDEMEYEGGGDGNENRKTVSNSFWG